MSHQYYDLGYKFYKSFLSEEEFNVIRDNYQKVANDKFYTFFQIDKTRGRTIRADNPPEYSELLNGVVKNKLEEELDTELEPAYTYQLTYLNNSYMIPHIDKPMCEVSLSIHIESNIPRLVEDDIFPLWILDYNNKFAKFNMNPNDAVLYNGPKVVHWRNPLSFPCEVFYNQVMFHYRIKNA